MGDSATLRLRREDLTWSRVDDEIVVLDNRTWEYLTVSGSGTALWELLLEGADRPRLVEHLLATFEVAPDRATADVEGWLAKLADLGLLEHVQVED